MPVKNHKEIEMELKKGILRPLYLLHGEEEFLKDNLAARLRRRILGPDNSGGEYIRLWAEDTAPEDLLMHVGSLSLFSTPKLIVLSFEKDFDYMVTPGHGLFGALDNPPQETRLVILARGKIKTRARKSKKESDIDPDAKDKKDKEENEAREVSIKKRGAKDSGAAGKIRFLSDRMDWWAEKGAVVEFPRMYENIAAAELDLWARERGMAFSGDGARKYLLERTGNDLARAVSEAAKCMLYLGGKGKIDEAVIDAVVPQSVEGKVYIMIEDLVAGNLSEARSILDQLRREKVEDISILSALAGHIRRLIEAGELMPDLKIPARYYKAAVEAELIRAKKTLGHRLPAGNNLLTRNPYAFWKLMQQAAGVESSVHWEILRDCYDVDMALKGRGKGDMRGPLALDMLLMKAFRAFNRKRTRSAC